MVYSTFYFYFAIMIFILFIFYSTDMILTFVLLLFVKFVQSA